METKKDNISNGMNKQLVVIVIIYLLFVASVISLYYSKTKKPIIEVNNKVNNFDVCERLNNEVDKINCRQPNVISDAASGGDLSKCNDLTLKTAIDNCLSQASFSLAVQKKDKKYCDKIINETDKKDCFKILGQMGVK